MTQAEQTHGYNYYAHIMYMHTKTECNVVHLKCT